MSTLLPILFYLEQDKKKGLQLLAKQNGTSISDEIRCAVNIYLNGINADDLMKFNLASRSVEKDLRFMAGILDATNQHLDMVFEEMDHLQREKSRPS